MSMTDEDARLLGWLDLAAHDEAHRLVTLRRDDPEAPSRESRFALKELLFHCHYSVASRCTYYGDRPGGRL